MFVVEKFINELMSSNCYIVYDDESHNCLIIDPGSEKSLREIAFIEQHQLHPEFVILTHEHTDHNWGVNALRDYFDLKIVAHIECAKAISKESRTYFQYYYDNFSYDYKIENIDVLINEKNSKLEWNNLEIKFIYTPGHSKGSMCINIDNLLFTGDTLMQCKPYISKRNGSKVEYTLSLNRIRFFLNKNVIIYPGHGDIFEFNNL